MTSSSPLYLAVSRQSAIAFVRIPRIFYVKECLLFIRNAWFDSGYMFCVRLGSLYGLATFSTLQGDPDPEFVSCPALRRPGMEKCAKQMLHFILRPVLRGNLDFFL